MKAQTLTIPVYRLEELEKKIRTLGRHAKRLGLEEPTMTVLRTTKREVPQVVTTVIRYEDESQESDHKRVVEVIDVTLETPEMGSSTGTYRSLAALQHLGTGDNGQRMVEVFAKNHETAKRAEPFRTETFCCEHCKTTRRRVWSLLVEEVGTDKILQLGSECADVYVSDPEAEIKKLQFNDLIVSIVREIEDGFDGERCKSGGGVTIGVEDALTIASHSMASVRTSGWHSRWLETTDVFQRAVENPRSTGVAIAYRVGFRSLKSVPGGTSLAKEEPYQITDADRAEAAAAIDWVKSCMDENEFLAGLKLLYGQDWISEKKIYQAAAIGVAWEKEKERRVAAARPPSSHVSEIKKRITMEVRVVRTFTYDGEFGPSTKYIMEDRDGNAMTWQTSSGSFPGHTPKNWYAIKATVKAHKEYKGVKQTDLSRVVIERDYQREAAEAAEKAFQASVSTALARPADELLKIASSEQTTPRMLSEIFSRSTEESVHKALARNPSTPDITLRTIAYTHRKHFEELSVNPSVSAEILRSILESKPSVEIQKTIARNPLIAEGGDGAAYIIEKSESKDVRLAFLQNPELGYGPSSRAVLRKMLKDADPEVADLSYRTLCKLIEIQTPKIEDPKATEAEKQQWVSLFTMKSMIDQPAVTAEAPTSSEIADRIEAKRFPGIQAPSF